MRENINKVSLAPLSTG